MSYFNNLRKYLQKAENILGKDQLTFQDSKDFISYLEDRMTEKELLEYHENDTFGVWNLIDSQDREDQLYDILCAFPFTTPISCFDNTDTKFTPAECLFIYSLQAMTGLYPVPSGDQIVTLLYNIYRRKENQTIPPVVSFLHNILICYPSLEKWLETKTKVEIGEDDVLEECRYIVSLKSFTVAYNYRKCILKLPSVLQNHCVEIVLYFLWLENDIINQDEARHILYYLLRSTSRIPIE